MQVFLDQGGYYLGIFLTLLATGLGFPLPEEIPVVSAGAIVGVGEAQTIYMIPTCILGVLIGDIFLYSIGRFWGAKLVERPFIQKRLLPPDRLASISENFQKYGIKILLFARLTPGIRSPIFITAGITRLPLSQFLLADAIYALPGVAILFGIGYWCADSIDNLRQQILEVKSWLILVVLAAVVIYCCYRFLRRPVLTGSPQEVPSFMEPVSQITRTMTEPILHAADSHHNTKIPEAMMHPHESHHSKKLPEPTPLSAPESTTQG